MRVDGTATTFRFLNLQIRDTCLFAPVSPLAPHLLECADSTFVPCPPRLDALPDPCLFLRQPLVKERIRLFFRRERLLFAFQKCVVVAGPVEQPPAIDFQNPRRDLAKKHPVVRHEQQRCRQLQKELFQPVDGINIQMVCRFVEQQQVRLVDQCSGKQDSSFHSR